MPKELIQSLAQDAARFRAIKAKQRRLQHQWDHREAMLRAADEADRDREAMRRELEKQSRILGDQGEILQQLNAAEHERLQAERETRESRNLLYHYEKQLEHIILLLNEPNYYNGMFEVKSLWDNYCDFEEQILNIDNYTDLEWKDKCDKIVKLKAKVNKMVENPPTEAAKRDKREAEQEIKRDTQNIVLLRELGEMQAAVRKWSEIYKDDGTPDDALSNYIRLVEQVKKNPGFLPFPLPVDEVGQLPVVNIALGGAPDECLLLTCCDCGSSQLEYDCNLTATIPAMEPLKNLKMPPAIPIKDYLDAISFYVGEVGFRVCPRVICQECGCNPRVPTLGEIGAYICSSYKEYTIAQEKLEAEGKEKLEVAKLEAERKEKLGAERKQKFETGGRSKKKQILILTGVIILGLVILAILIFVV